MKKINKILIAVGLIFIALLGFARFTHAQTNTTQGGTGLSSYTAGDMLYWASGLKFTKLGIGSNGQCLTVATGVPAWGSCAGGAGVVLDLWDDGADESTSIAEIATSGDTNSIFSEPTANKFLINLALDWPKADTADDLTCTNCINATEIDGGALESELEAVVDLQDLQGAVTDAQVPNTITVDTATLASTVTVVSSGGDTTSFIPIFDTDTGSLAVKSDINLKWNATSNILEIDGPAHIGGNLTSVTSDQASLGTTAVQWGDLFLAEGGVINWDNGDATLTQTGNDVALAGASFTSSTVNIDLLDGVGAVDMDYGSVDITDHTFTTDGTGDAEIVLPVGSISTGEILNATILAEDLKAVDSPADEECLTKEDTTGDFEWQACGSGGATAYNDIGDPTGNGSITFGTFTNIWNTSLDGGNVFDISNADADLASDTTLLKLGLRDNGDVNGIFVDFIDDLSGTPNSVFSIGADGVISSDAGGTFAGTITTPTLDLSGTGTINGLDAIDATSETTLEATLDIAGDVSSTGLSTTVIGADKVLESMLKAVDAAGDEECLTYESTVGDFEWQTCGGGGSFDSTTVDSTTWSDNANASNTWTFDVSGTDTTWAMGNNNWVFGTSSVDLGAAGVRLSHDADGALTFLGMGNGSDEDLTMNFDDVANTVGLTSSTGLNRFNFGAISPQINDNGYISDPNGEEILGFNSTGTANYLEVNNAGATAKPGFASVGSDTNISIDILPKGTGELQVNGDSVMYDCVELGLDPYSKITTGTDKDSIVMPYAMTVAHVYASLTTGPTGSVATFDINEAGTSIISTKITIDVSETSSQTAATPAVISDSAIAKGSKLSFDTDGVGSTTSGNGIHIQVCGNISY